MRARSRTLFAARTLALLAFTLTATTTLLNSHAPTATTAAASRQRRRTAAPDYTRFSHVSAAHAKRDCASCHRVVSFERPDITDFPDHPSCVECHRRQFFRGARPIICSDCHSAVSPRAGARLPFPKPTAAAEFADVFPHANHIKTTSLIQFKKVIGERSNIQATCLYCHRPNPAPTQTKQALPQRATTRPASGPPALASGPPAFASGPPALAFVPPAGTYMTTPTSHASCFQCHWQKGVADHEQEPYAAECASCHRNVNAPASARASATTTTPVAVVAAPLSPAALPSPSASPLASASFLTARAFASPPRAAPKFVHEIDAHKKRLNEEGREVAITCLQCHAAARKAETLETLRLKENRAGLPTCSSSACHTAVAGAAQLHLSVYRELRERGRDARFDCALCHTPPASLAPEAPCTHYAAVYASALKEKKSTKGIEQLTPPRCAAALKGNAP